MTKKKNAPKPAAESVFPVVAVGASAGGLEALEELLEHLPDDTGMAFLIVTHQHPGHTSLLPELLGKCTGMPVVQAQGGVRLEPDHIYVSPPGEQVAVMKAKIQLMGPPEHGSPPLLVDFCFRSLAEDLGERAVCIVLSGTGSDGTVGLRAVKGAGGLVMVQEVESARYGGMPSSAIATKLADCVLPPAEMPDRLAAFARSLARGEPTDDEVPRRLQQPLQKIFMLLRSRTGHDFSAYKPRTMHRRVERRMTVHRLQEPEEYVQLLRDNPHEIDLLFKDLLIGVTSFFRDPEVFGMLAGEALPALMAARPEGHTFRAWIPGCCSGEEAYTLAILLRRAARKADKHFEFQLFATDLDAEAIESARTGVYPVGIAADVPPEILKECFQREDDAYRVRKEIREMVVFAEHNVIKDPPFTKLDLLSCRNLLIYLNGDLQQRLLPVFHYALSPGGLLLLGTSESVGSFDDLFALVNRKWKLYKRKESPACSLPEMPAQAVSPGDGDGTRSGASPALRPAHVSGQLEKLLLSRFAPPTAVVNVRGDIVYIHGRTGLYLEPSAGRPRHNIHDMAREGLQFALAAALRKAVGGEPEVTQPRVRVKTNGDYTYIDLEIARITHPQTLRGLLLVSFRPSPQAPPEPAGHERASDETDDSPHTRELERELRHTQESLQSTVEELETSNEELKSSNEELQSTNEELQSTNEELETSKEEMQSLNEELTTVNAELESKVDALSRANDDMQNLLNSTDIATLFLDDDLHIQRYTEQARNIINLIPTDIGRPIGDLVSGLRYDGVVGDAQGVLRTLERKEMQVEGRDGTWYLMRILPYRTADNVIDGLVITFIDITDTKQAEAATEAEQQGRALLQTIFDTIQVPALVLDADLRVDKANHAFCDTFATNPPKTEGQLVYDVGGGEWDIAELRRLLEEVVPEQAAIADYEVSAKFPKIGQRTFRLNARRLDRETGLPGLILLTMADRNG